MDEFLKEFFAKIEHHAKRKAKLYDGFNHSTGFDKDKFKLIAGLSEELGEIASAVTRERPEAAKAECIDLAHCVFLLYSRLNNE